MNAGATGDEPPDTAGGRVGSIAGVVVGLAVVVVVAYLVVPGWRHKADASLPASQQQVVTAEPAVDPALVAQLRALPGGTQGAPAILTYHDISTKPGFYNVTPAAFAEQMRLLHEAAFHTMTGAQLKAWLDGAPLPPHSVLLSFDDGANGVWQYADPILARYGFHAMAFIITGFVGTSQPYYMTWPKIAQLAASGRWDLESHTHLGHVQVPTDDHGGMGAFLTSLQYLDAQHRPETIPEYTARVSGDLAESKNQLMAHGLPAPDFFAYPFSAHDDNPQTTPILRNLVSTDFRAAMLDESRSVAATTTADLAGRNLRRTDVIASTTPDLWLNNLRSSIALDPATAAPLKTPGNWVNSVGKPAPLVIKDDTVILDPGASNSTQRIFARQQTSFWQTYTASATLGGFRAVGDGTTTGIGVLTNDPQQVELDVSNGSYSVVQGLGPAKRVLTQGNLPPATSYSATLAVTPNAVSASVDGRVIANVRRDPNSGPASGGIAITGARTNSSSPLPVISRLVTSE